MRADEGALIALDTLFRLPFRHIKGNSSLFILCCSKGKRPVLITLKSADGYTVTLLPVHWKHNMIDKMVQFSGSCFYPDRCGIRTFSLRSQCLYIYLFQTSGRSINCRKILFNDFLTLMSVIFHHFFFQITYRLFHRDNSGQSKKKRTA